MANVRVTFELPKTHQALATPKKWDDDWEALLKRPMLTSPQLNGTFIKSAYRSTLDEDYHEYAILRKTTCEIEHRASFYASQHMSELEPAWLASTREERRKHVLIGMSTVCSKARNLNDARTYCADVLRLDKLTRNPETFLDFLRSIMIENIFEMPTTPKYIPNAEWDAYEAKMERTGSDKEKIIAKYMVILRTKLIYMCMEFSFLSFLGEPLPELTMMKLKATQADPAFNKMGTKLRTTALGKKEGKQLNKDDKAAQKDRASKSVAWCSCCFAQAAPGESFKQCQKCKEKMNRGILYCSRECQLKDWPNHKLSCGKPLDLDSAIASFTSSHAPKIFAETPNVPTPTGGFKFNNELMKHLLILRKGPNLDLVLNLKPEPLDIRSDYTMTLGTHPIDAPFPPLKKALRAVRDKAMTTGDKGMAAVLCHYAVWYLAITQAGDDSLSSKIDCVAEEFAREFDMTASEMKKAVLALHEKCLTDRFARPPLIISGEMNVAEWTMLVAGKGWNMSKRIVFKDLDKK